MKKLYSVFTFFYLTILALQAQDSGRITGNLETNGNFFLRDSLIGAVNTPQYDRQLYGAEAWLNLRYSNWGFDFGLRFDLFNNSNLLNPRGSFTDEGIGRWFVNKKIDKFEISAGYLYDQIGSGVIFRAFEDRPLLIDNALFGLRLAWEPAPDWRVKVFTGRQKQQFEMYPTVIKGGSVEGYFAVGDSTRTVVFSPGIGVVNRTLDDGTMEKLVAEISTYRPEDRFSPTYNVYAFSGFNTLTFGGFSWYVEGAYKTKEGIYDVFDTRITWALDTIAGNFVSTDGSVLYSSLSYAGGSFGVTVEGKRTENFSLRASPFLRLEKLNDGLINFLPPMARINTYRLTGRYNAATQELGELAFQVDASYAPSNNLSFNVNYSDIKDLNDTRLYQEVYVEFLLKKKGKWQLLGGAQHQKYNQAIYETKPNVPLVETITPFVDFLYKIDKKKSIRAELQYMNTGQDKAAGYDQDYGDWLFGLAEFSIAPHWTFTASDMFNINPGKNSPVGDDGQKLKLHYPRFDVFYNFKSHRFSLSYVKQVEGVVCTGGICRLEPAFHGVRLTANSTF
jgi:hypothetical protein